MVPSNNRPAELTQLLSNLNLTRPDGQAVDNSFITNEPPVTDNALLEGIERPQTITEIAQQVATEIPGDTREAPFENVLTQELLTEMVNTRDLHNKARMSETYGIKIEDKNVKKLEALQLSEASIIEERTRLQKEANKLEATQRALIGTINNLITYTTPGGAIRTSLELNKTNPTTLDEYLVDLDVSLKEIGMDTDGNGMRAVDALKSGDLTPEIIEALLTDHKENAVKEAREVTKRKAETRESLSQQEGKVSRSTNAREIQDTIVTEIVKTVEELATVRVENTRALQEARLAQSHLEFLLSTAVTELGMDEHAASAVELTRTADQLEQLLKETDGTAQAKFDLSSWGKKTLQGESNVLTNEQRDKIFQPGNKFAEQLAQMRQSLGQNSTPEERRRVAMELINRYAPGYSTEAPEAYIAAVRSVAHEIQETQENAQLKLEALETSNKALSQATNTYSSKIKAIEIAERKLEEDFKFQQEVDKRIAESQATHEEAIRLQEEENKRKADRQVVLEEEMQQLTQNNIIKKWLFNTFLKKK